MKMDCWKTFCRVLMLLLGLSCLAVIGFLGYDTVVNFNGCKLPIDILGRISLACLAIGISMCCGLIPKPPFPTCVGWPSPWKISKTCCCGRLPYRTLREDSSDQASSPDTSTSRNVSSSSSSQQQPGASASRANFDTSDFPKLEDTGKTSDDIYSDKRQRRKKVSFASDVSTQHNAEEPAENEHVNTEHNAQAPAENKVVKSPVDSDIEMKKNLPFHLRVPEEMRKSLGAANHLRSQLSLIGLKKRPASRRLPPSHPFYDVSCAKHVELDTPPSEECDIDFPLLEISLGIPPAVLKPDTDKGETSPVLQPVAA